MKFALVNPNWSFEGSIYFGCREPHLPLEYGYAKALLERAGHQAALVDAQMERLELAAIRERLLAFEPDFTVLTTAPSYLFWRCAPPELRIPRELADAVRDVAGRMVVVGPHASTTPRATLRKLGADAAVLGECEEVLPELAGGWEKATSVAYSDEGGVRINGGTRASDMTALPGLSWPRATIAAHAHHHHRFDETPAVPGAEMEVSRGCPYHCTFCAKDNFRSDYRRRPLGIVLEELDGLIEQGVGYIYFIDEIFLPWQELLQAVAARPVKFGVQTRIDLWNERMLDLLGEAGCVSVEAGVESISDLGRNLLDKKCRLSTDELAGRLIHAKRRIPFVQANLIEMRTDDPGEVESFRGQLIRHGVWANKPVPLFPYPGSPDYAIRWGLPDDRAWERAHDYYLNRYAEFSDVQDDRPVPLVQLEVNAPV
ncbi:MAG: TIGR04295 family B12-binding domain-containing radical SAM protein [Bryobacteraceae bacterium]|nr:TIGR04295 family B12-binding domain-containing radical SAM protein [Bryobacteraceae bacterium]